MAFLPILIVADDLTGAADCAVQFRQAGFSALVLANRIGHRPTFGRAQVISLNLHTRDLPTAAAVRRRWRRRSAAIAVFAQGAFVYQKIDSTLRGHPALEVRLLLDLLGWSTAIIAPAFPKLGRQTLDGVHRVHGVPLAKTEYARQQRRALASSSLPEIFREASGTLAAHLPGTVIDGGVQAVVTWLQDHGAGAGRLITADAAHEQHLDILTQVVLALDQRVLLVGSAGWAERLALAGKELMPELPLAPGVLGIVGSLSAVATQQVQTARAAGAAVIHYTPTGVGSDITTDAWHALTRALAAGQHAVIWTHTGDLQATTAGSGRQVLRTLAGTVQDMLSTTAVSGLVIVGGETAQAVLRAMHASGLSLCGQVVVGVPYGRLVGGAYAGLAVATKAGGFGTDTTLADCLDFVQRWASQ